MKRINLMKFVNVLSVLLLGLAVIISCTDDTTPGLNNNPDVQGEEDQAIPVITSVEPEFGIAGVSTITITGSNFSEEPDWNLVCFDYEFAEVLEASSSKLVVRAPLLEKDSINLRVSMQDGDSFSNSVLYKLEPPVSLVYDFLDIEDPYSLAFDNNDNLYFSLGGAGIWKLGDDGKIVQYSPKGAETFYSDLKAGPNSNFYGVRSVRAIFEIAEGQSPQAKAVDQTTSKLKTLDFDSELNIWAGGDGGTIWRFDGSTFETMSFAFDYKISSIRVYNSYLYLGVERNSNLEVWRIQIISADELGEPEFVYNVSENAAPGTESIAGIAFSQSGRLFIGTDGEMELIVLNTDGTSEEWYPGLLTGPIVNMTWDNGNFLYFTSDKLSNASGEIIQQQLIYKVNMEMPGAPYYGRQ